MTIHASVSGRQSFVVGLSLFMATVLIMGLLRRERQGPGGVGFETIVLIAACLVGSAALIAAG